MSPLATTQHCNQGCNLQLLQQSPRPLGDGAPAPRSPLVAEGLNAPALGARAARLCAMRGVHVGVAEMSARTQCTVLGCSNSSSNYND